MEGEVCRDQVCLDSEAETQYLQVISHNCVDEKVTGSWHGNTFKLYFCHWTFQWELKIPSCRISVKCCPTWYYQRANLAQVTLSAFDTLYNSHNSDKVAVSEERHAKFVLYVKQLWSKVISNCRLWCLFGRWYHYKQHSRNQSHLGICRSSQMPDQGNPCWLPDQTRLG